MIDWNDNAKAAVNTYNDWSLENDLGIHAFFEHLTNNGHTQPKTVADAVEVFGAKWPSSRYNFAWWDSDTEQMPLGCNETSDTVCTRAEFEEYVKEQEGEEWTHVVNFGFSEQAQCKIISEHGDFLWVKVDGAGCPATYKKSELKPIKPTISKDAKRQLELYVQYRVDKYGDYAMKSELSDYMSHHDII